MRHSLSLLLLLSAAPLLHAQTTAEIIGTVSDSSGAVVSGATAKLVNLATNQQRSVQTNGTGSYQIPFLNPGFYSLEVSKEGFKSVVRSSFEILVGDVKRLDFALELGVTTQKVEVSGAAPLLTTDSEAVGTVIETKRVEELPLNGRNYLQLVSLSPNVSAEQQKGGFAASRQGGDRATQSIAVAGQRMTFNQFTLDGVENTDVNFNTYIVRPSIDAIQEFKTQIGIYSAEYGREVSQVNVTTRSGSNQYHGTLFEFLRNDAMDTREWNNPTKNPFRRNQFGFTFGGPVLKDRLFFLSNFEALRDRKTLQSVATVPTDAMRGGNFSGVASIFDPSTRAFSNIGGILSVAPFAGNIIPSSRFDPIALKLLAYYPAPTVASAAPGSNYSANLSRPINEEEFTQRIDWIQTDKSSWFARFSWGDDDVTTLNSFANQTAPTTTAVFQGVLANTRTISPAMVNEARFGVNQFNNEVLTHFAYSQDISGQLGIKGLGTPPPSAYGLPEIDLSNGLAYFGDSLNGPFINHNTTLQGLDTLAVTRGSHLLKLGGEIRRDRYNQQGNTYARGDFQFLGGATSNPAAPATSGYSFADFLIGQSTVSQRALGLADAMLRSTSFAFFVDDTWRVNPKLTISLGLRYENTAPFSDKYRGAINLELTGGILDPTHVPVLVRPGDGSFYQGLLFHFADNIPIATGDSAMGHALVNRDNLNFAPRVGISYSPSSRWTIRTGFGIFYSQDAGNAVFDMSRNLAGRDQLNASATNPNSPLADPRGAEQASALCSGWSGTCLAAPVPLANYAQHRTPYVEQWMFNLQRQFGENLAFELGYLGNEGHQLQLITNINVPSLPTGPSDTRTLSQRQPWPEYNNIQEMGNLAQSNYHSLSAKLTRRFTKGLTALVGYTWSKAIDNGSGLRSDPGDVGVPPPDPYDLNSLRALSQFDERHRGVASILYDLPFGRAKAIDVTNPILNQIVGGWQLGSIVTLATGNPWTVATIGNTNNIGIAQFPDATGISPIPANQNAQHFWNAAAYSAASPTLPYRFGTAGRNQLTTPGYANWDFSAFKNFDFTETRKLQFRFEGFNITNHPNWNPPAIADPRSSAFGVITTARTMRELQLALKLFF